MAFLMKKIMKYILVIIGLFMAVLYFYSNNHIDKTSAICIAISIVISGYFGEKILQKNRK
jgi:uncharacterized membrane protein